MGVSYSYECTKAKIKETVKELEDGTKLVLCDLKFKDENGRPFEMYENVLVYIGKDSAEIVDEASDYFPEDVELGEEYDKLQALADENNPGFEVYNEEEFYQILTKS